MNASPTPPDDLKQLQTWMQTVITHPLGVEAGIESEDSKSCLDLSAAQIESVIRPSRARTAVQRLEVYSNAYIARLLECLRELFPASALAMGEDVFDEFAFDYLQQYPPHSYTLGDLADRFVEYLQKTRPEERSNSADDASASGQPDWTDFIIDLATLEWTIDQVFDGPGVENDPPLSPEDLKQLSTDRWLRCRLLSAPCLRLLSLKFPLNDYYTQFRKTGQEPAFPSPQATYLAITRRDYIVRRIPLSQPEHQLLTSLVSGAAVEDALAHAAQSVVSDQALVQLSNHLQTWFAQWTAAGFFVGIEESPSD